MPEDISPHVCPAYAAFSSEHSRPNPRLSQGQRLRALSAKFTACEDFDISFVSDSVETRLIQRLLPGSAEINTFWDEDGEDVRGYCDVAKTVSLL